MPLHKRKPFHLLEPPQDLEPKETVYQVRFTKEIFRDYEEYLNRINLYRHRVWTCKFTGKTNLTYEEALVSEQRATEKIQQFPEELVSPVLHMIQFSTLRLMDLVNTISKKLQENLAEGAELYARKEQSICPCKILRVLKDSEKSRYEVGWTDKDKKIIGRSTVNSDDLIKKKLPFSREVLKSFIRESTSQNGPWIIHEKLAKKFNISTELPVELQEEMDSQDEHLGNKKEMKRGGSGTKKRKRLETEKSKSLPMIKKASKEERKQEPIKYPIDDLLVKPSAYDPVLTDRPAPMRDFGVPMDCVGDLLMIWDFCSSFSKLLHLWPFSLEDFENAICHKDSNVTLIMETHSAIIRLLIKDGGDYYTLIQKKKRKAKITLITWAEYLCDFLEVKGMPELSTHIATIRRGHYGILEIRAKLNIFQELITVVLATDAVREQLDQYIEQQQELAATKRGEAIEEARKRKEEKEINKVESDVKEVREKTLANGGGKLQISENGSSGKQNGMEKLDVDALSSKRKKISGNGDKGKDAMKSKKEKVGRKVREKLADEDATELLSEKGHNKVKKRQKDKEKENQEKKNKEQWKEHLEREIEKRFVRTNPLGKDKNYNRYWFFRRDGRIFIESSDSKEWGYYSSKEELDALMGSLNVKGERERALKRHLEKQYQRICLALQKRSKSKIALDEAVLRRSTRVRAPRRDNPAMAFLKYVNKWKDN
ncbi:hypothetical protein Sjap_021399 [Stephania japonica]|uniref:DDT domain-containing protein n=1 Tax=Stephania japonica TaxID=461633 RepID=A0AAP0EQ31_9MAGN